MRKNRAATAGWEIMANGRVVFRKQGSEDDFETVAEFEFTDDLVAFCQTAHFRKNYSEEKYQIRMERYSFFSGWKKVEFDGSDFTGLQDVEEETPAPSPETAQEKTNGA